MNPIKEELFETLANEINCSDWTLDSQTIVAAVNQERSELLIHLADGRSFTVSAVANRRKHGKNRTRKAGDSRGSKLSAKAKEVRVRG